MADELTHEQAIELLDALRDGELSPEEAAPVEKHVEACPRCRAVESALGGSLRKAVTEGAAQSQPDLLEGVQRRLRLRSRGRFYGEQREKSGFMSPWPLIIGSVAVLAALIISYLLIGQVAAPTAPPKSTPTLPPIPAPSPS